MISLHYTSHTKAYNTIYTACNIVEAIYSFTKGDEHPTLPLRYCNVSLCLSRLKWRRCRRSLLWFDSWWTIAAESQLGRQSASGYVAAVVLVTSKTCSQKFFSQVVIDEWNQLPKYVIIEDSLDSFKKRLDNHMKPWRWAIKASAYLSS